MSDSTMRFESYDEWERSTPMSPVSPEAFFAEKAWNAVIHRMEELVEAGFTAENCESEDAVRFLTLLREELSALDTGL